MALVRSAMVDQQAVQRVVIAATKLIHTPQISQQLLKMLKASQDPAAGLAQTTVFVMKTLIEQSKGSIQPQAIVPAGKEVIGLLAELAQAAGLFKVDDKIIAKAMVIIAQGLKLAAQKQQQPQQAQAQQPAQPQAQPRGVIGQAMGA